MILSKDKSSEKQFYLSFYYFLGYAERQGAKFQICRTWNKCVSLEMKFVNRTEEIFLVLICGMMKVK